MSTTHLTIAGVTRLSVAGRTGRGPRDAFVFDPHRLALPCWALALHEARPAVSPPALLVTLDRHLDLVAPPPAALPEVRAVDDVLLERRHPLSPATEPIRLRG